MLRFVVSTIFVSSAAVFLPQGDAAAQVPTLFFGPAEYLTADDVPVKEALLRLLGCADLCSKRWIWEQYDHMVMADTVQRPGGDAGVVRVHGTDKAIAVSCDVSPRYCAADPFEGAKQAVAECWRNLTAVGAEPLAVTDNLNFGNPERPETMGELVGAVKGYRVVTARFHRRDVGHTRRPV